MASKRSRAVNVDFLQEEGSDTDLSAIFARSVSDLTPPIQVAPDHLLDNPYQQRAQMDPARLAELAAVITAQGFQGVLVARPHPTRRGFYQLAFGHRRRDAAKQAGVAVVPVQVRDLSEEEMVELVITENIQRDDLTLLEEGRTFQMMLDLLGYTQEQIARQVGKTRGYVENRLRVARAPADVQELVVAKPDSLRAVAALIKVDDAPLRAAAIRELQAGHLTADDLPGYLAAGRSAAAAERASHRADQGSVSSEAINGLVATQTPALNGTRKNGAVETIVADADAASTLAAAPPEQVTTPPAAALDGDEAAGARVGYGTLMTALRALTRYRDRRDTQADISLREQIALADLKNLALELYERHGSPAGL